MGKLSRKVRFICSVESNSAVESDGLISVLFEINALNMNALFLLATSTITKAGLTWLPSCKPQNQELQGYTLANMVHHSHGLEWQLVSNIYQLKKQQYFLQTQMDRSTLLCSVLCGFSNQVSTSSGISALCNLAISHLHKVDFFLKILL